MGGGPGGPAWRTHSAGPEGAEEFDFGQFFGGRFGGQGGGVESAFGDMFKQFTGGASTGPRRGQRRTARGADLQHQLEIPFNTSVIGGEARLNVQRPNGKVETISVKIPAGIEDGKTIRLRGQGEKGPAAGQPGDLLITVRVAPHPCYERKGNDLEVRVPVSVAEAALGAKVELPTPKGVISLKLPPRTSSGKRLRVKGHGVQGRNGQVGDLYAEVQIVLPPSLDEESTDLIRQLDRRHSFQPRAGLQW
jgi:DnaJ-class molecular chaperone